MATLDEAFPSRFLKASDLKGKSRLVEIIDTNQEVLKDLQGKSATKTVVYFKDMKKALPLNKTNFQALVRITNEADSQDWVGHKALMVPTKTEMAGKPCDCIRFEDAPKGKAKLKAVAVPSDDLDDDVSDISPDVSDEEVGMDDIPFTT